MDPDSVLVDSGCDSVLGIPVTVPAEFEFRSEFRRNRNYNLAGTSAKFPFPRNSRNHPDSGGFHLEYVGDCKELDSRETQGSFIFPKILTRESLAI